MLSFKKNKKLLHTNFYVHFLTWVLQFFSHGLVEIFKSTKKGGIIGITVDVIKSTFKKQWCLCPNTSNTRLAQLT